MCARAGLSMELSRKFAKMKNMGHFSDFYVQCPYANVLINLRMKYDLLKLKGGMFTATTVASAYSGDKKYRSASLKKTAQTAIRLLASVIKHVRDIANVDNSFLCSVKTFPSRLWAKTVEKFEQLANCRSFS